MKLEAEGRHHYSLYRTIFLTVKGLYNFCAECFLTCFWRFLRFNTIEQLEFKLEKIIETYRKSLKNCNEAQI